MKTRPHYRSIARVAAFSILSAFSLHSGSAHAAGEETAKPQSKSARPKLIVGLMLDQMRWDFLHRYADSYGEDGFKRLLNHGFSCDETQINYVPTYTGCGHASVYTGTVPAIHGITGNNFVMHDEGKMVYCVEDESVSTVGSETDAGMMSPKNLLSSTLGDEMRLATNFRSKVVAISLKDRGAILPGGHSANAAYWYDGSGQGQWITSTYYRPDLPEWVQCFNREKPASSYLKNDWHRIDPDTNAYAQSEPDDSPYETPLVPEGKSVLPLPTSTMPKQGELLRTTPFGNTITLEFAQEAVIQEGLGTDEFPDLLAVSLSSTDYIGHQFGPNSVEVEDTYLRLDRELGAFLKFLDIAIGKDNYILFLTADHGAAHNANYLRSKKLPAGVWPNSMISRSLSSFLEEKYKIAKLVMKIDNSQVILNRNLIRASNLDEDEISRQCVNFLRTQTGVSDAFLTNQTNLQSIPDFLRTRCINGYNFNRSGQVQIVLKPGWYDFGLFTGTTHGSWSPYDSHIPLIWYGANIPQGETHRSTSIADIAPTLAALLDIQAPNGSSGQVIQEIVNRPVLPNP